MEDIEIYLETLPLDQQKIMELLHNQLSIIPHITGKIRYAIPFYYRHSWICYLNPLKSGGVELAFTRANELLAVKDLLDFSNRKQVGGIRYSHPGAIDWNVFQVVLQEALLLDEKVSYASKRKKK
jgi:hypothetical protein